MHGSGRPLLTASATLRRAENRGVGTVAHITHKIVQDLIDSRRAVPALRHVIDEGRFAIAVVTYSDDKAAAIKQALLQIQTTVSFRVEAGPEGLVPRGGPVH